MPGSLLDMQLVFTKDSEKLATGIYKAFRAVLENRLKLYSDLLVTYSRNPEEYKAITREMPSRIEFKRDDIEKYLRFYDLGFDDFFIIKEKFFGNKEIKPRPSENVRGHDIYLIHLFKGYSGEDEPNVGMRRAELMFDALNRASAGNIIAVFPYAPYERQDRKDESRVPISFKDFAKSIESRNVSRLITLDMHAPQEQGFFEIPVDNLTPIDLFADAINQLRKSHEVVLVSPDAGSLSRNNDLVKLLNLPTAIVDKTREQYESSVRGMQGIENIPGKAAILVDDLIGSGGTLIKAAKNIKTYGPEKIIAIATHYLGNPSKIDDSVTGTQKLEECGLFDAIYVTNSNFSEEWVNHPLLKVVPLDSLLAEAIYETQIHGSISKLFPEVNKKS